MDTEPLELHREKWMVRALSLDGPQATHAARTVHLLQADSLQNLSQQKQLAKRIEMKAIKNTRRTRRTHGWKAPRGQSAYLPRTVRQSREQQPEPETASTQAPIRPRISQTA
jgi:hypothetical protein